jgi:FixJ family two-component response regulator
MPQVAGGVAGRVHLVDDDPSVRRALTRLLRAAGLEVASFGSAEAFLASPPPEGASCAVLDLRMPGLDGLALQEELQRRGIDMPLLFISGHADVKSTVGAMKRGALDFLEKPVSDTQLLDGVRRALERDRVRRLERGDRATLDARLARLTPRERDVFALVAAGLLNKQVAGELAITEKTVKVHRARVMEKMEAGSLAELVRLADRLGLSRGSSAPDDRPLPTRGA